MLPAARWGELGTLICEVPERLPKLGQIQAGTIVSVGPDTLIQDFAAIVSFGLNVTCTPDRDLASRLVVARRPPLGIAAIPKKFVPRMFDENIPYVQQEADDLAELIKSVMGLRRATYVGAMRAIRRYVTAMHRLADDLDLAYTLLVASIESLVQGFDRFEPVWEDLDSNKRKPIDIALQGAPADIVTNVRAAILKTEHAAIKRRFLEFSHRHVPPTFFRGEAGGQLLPAGRTALIQGLKSAYDLRSGYIHVLQPLPTNLVNSANHIDLHFEGGRPLLTFCGLARVARRIILEFIQRAPKVEREEHDYFKDYPNVITAELAPQYWIHNADGYSQKTARQYLNGFLSQYTAHLYAPAPPKITDIRGVARKIEMLVPGMSKPDQKLPMLLLYYLFSKFLPAIENQVAREFLAPYLSLFDTPSVESLCAYILTNAQGPDWPLEVSDQLLMDYAVKRFNKNALNAGSLIGAAMFLWLAELHRSVGNEARSRELISSAVDEYPEQIRLREFEMHLPYGNLPEINCWRILVPQTLEASVPPVPPVSPA